MTRRKDPNLADWVSENFDKDIVRRIVEAPMPTLEQIEAQMAASVRDGYMEIVGVKDGKNEYRLTKRGEECVKTLMKPKGHG